MRTGTLSPTHVDCALAACHYLTYAPFSFKNSHWYNQIRELHTCFCAKVQMSTPLLKDRPWLFAHMFYMSIPRPDLRGFSFLFFAEYIFSYVVRTYMWINVSNKSDNHTSVWELHTSAATPHSWLFSVASTTNLVRHNIFTSFVDRHKNINV